MIWALLWLLIGLLFLGVILWINRRDEPPWRSGLATRDTATWRGRLVEGVLAPVLAGLVVVVCWPLVLALGIWEWLKDRRQGQREKAALFAVRADHLRQAMSVPEVELAERLRDPLRAVPDLPFGHLNAAWRAFVAQRPQGAELWRFSGDWADVADRVRERRGYVWVRGAVRQPWWITRDVSKERDHA